MQQTFSRVLPYWQETIVPEPPAWETGSRRISPACLALIDYAVGWIVRFRANEVNHSHGTSVGIQP